MPPSSDPLLSDPLRDDSPAAWARLVESLGPASVLVCIRGRMGPELQGAVTPEDIWQETLLHVWRDRAQLEWRGVRAFRRFVLQVAENRIRNAVDALRAQRRGGGAKITALDSPSTADAPPPVASTTPSRVASDRERADLMQAALDGLPNDLREVVRLRLFEERSVDEVARELGIGESAVKHRLRKGAGHYQALLRQVLESRSGG